MGHTQTDLPEMAFYTVRAVAAALAVSETTIRKLIAHGHLVAFKVGGVIRISEKALADFQANHSAKKPAGTSRPAKKKTDPPVIQHHFA